MMSHLVKALLDRVSWRITQYCNQAVGLTLQVETYHSILQQDIEYWDVHSQDDAWDTLSSADYCMSDLLRYPQDLLRQLTSIISTMILLYRKNARLLAFMMASAPVNFILSHYVSVVTREIALRVRMQQVSSWSRFLGGA